MLKKKPLIYTASRIPKRIPFNLFTTSSMPIKKILRYYAGMDKMLFYFDPKFNFKGRGRTQEISGRKCTVFSQLSRILRMYAHNIKQSASHSS